MNWIKLTPESVLPEAQTVFVRISNGVMHCYDTGFATGNQIFLENEAMEKGITHYAEIEEPADVPKPDPVQHSTDFPFSS